MKVKFYVDCAKEQTIITESLGYSDDEWRNLSDDEKYQIVEEWAMEHMSYGYEELE